MCTDQGQPPLNHYRYFAQCRPECAADGFLTLIKGVLRRSLIERRGGRSVCAYSHKDCSGGLKVGPFPYRAYPPSKRTLSKAKERLAVARCVKKRFDGEGEGLVAPMLRRTPSGCSHARSHIYVLRSLVAICIVPSTTTLTLVLSRGLLLVQAAHHILLTNRLWFSLTDRFEPYSIDHFTGN